VSGEGMQGIRRFVCTEKILMGEERWGREMKETVRKVDHSRCLVRCHEKASMIARVEEEIGWRRLWDELLSFKLRHMGGCKHFQD